MKIIQKRDYDTTYNINDRDIKCYSKKKMKDLYPDGNYEIVGETFEKNDKEEIDKIELAKKELIVSKYGDNSKLKYSRKYFIAVGKDEYICLLKSRLFLFLLLFLLLLIIVTLGSILYIYFHTPTLNPDYPLPDEDKNATEIESDKTKKAESKNGGSVRIRLSDKAIINLKTGNIDMAFQNPNQSNQDSVITLVLINNGKEYIIARSGLIKAGNQITRMALNNTSINLSKGVYKGKYVIDHYNPKTGEKAITDSNFNDIEIQVK